MYNNEFNLDFIHLYTNVVIKYILKYFFLWGKGLIMTKVPRAHKSHSAALSPCQLCSSTYLALCKVEEECVFDPGWADIGIKDWSGKKYTGVH